MKKSIASLLLICALSVASLSFANPPVTEKVLKQFSISFPTVTDAKWFEGDTYFDVYFEKEETKYNIRYDRGGKVLSTRNYYSGAKLSPFLHAKLAEKFPGKSVFGVTEITNSEEMFYVIALEDKTTWTNVRADAVGQLTVLEKLKKAN
ncbi:MAG: hypothetical protein EOO14_06185 [Chitinophagaceae bacterium]|nr:MAG: hypothetical protein EOO14_06185 [Chitinophagaceae bacterium]